MSKLKLNCIVAAPWKIDPSGPFFASVNYFEKKLQGLCGFDLQLKKSSSQDEKQNTQFLLNLANNLITQKYQLFCLDERGKHFSSAELAEMLARGLAQGFRGQAFLLGSAYGLPRELLESEQVRQGFNLVPLSLSGMTFSHELALVIILEQIYRAQCILNNHPYHHAAPSPFSSELKPK